VKIRRKSISYERSNIGATIRSALIASIAAIIAAFIGGAFSLLVQ
jgi:hypothetical protein